MKLDNKVLRDNFCSKEVTKHSITQLNPQQKLAGMLASNMHNKLVYRILEQAVQNSRTWHELFISRLQMHFYSY